MLWIPAAFGLVALAPPAGVAANLLENPTMREGLLFPVGWSADGGSPGAVEWLGSDDGQLHAVRIHKTGTVEWLGVTSQPRVACLAGTEIRVCGWVRSNRSIGQRTQLFVRFFDSAGRFLGQAGPDVPANLSEWTRIEAVAAAPEGCALCDVSLQTWDEDAEVLLTSVGLAPASVTDLCSQAPADAAMAAIEGPRLGAADADGDGLSDPVEEVLGTDPGTADTLARASRRRTTSFQTHMGYMPEHDVRTDVVIIAGNQETAIRTWATMGYEPHVMVGFRDGEEYVREHPDQVQRRSNGAPLTCGPGSYYMVPTPDRIARFREFFRVAVERGARAACPEEAEYIGPGAYAPAFQQEWEREYGAPWEDPAQSIDARWKACQLMAKLERDLVNACWDGARDADPEAELFSLTHSPINYASWNIVSPHWSLIREGRVQSVVGQVWTGTARTPNRLRGVSRERTFETGYLEYASLVGLTRDLGIDLWFLMDPLEDNPDRTMEDYLTNYQRTLVASLFFPETDRFEVMPWPARIFGRVPDEFATIIDSVVTSLADIQNWPDSRLEPERPRIATFVADSLQWQREPPSPSNFDSLFGLCLPFVADGVPVEVAQLERAADPAYLAPYKTLLLSYDAFKPTDPAIHDGIAQWVRDGGELLIAGGEDAYNRLDEWWTREGFARPQDHLLAKLGIETQGEVEGQTETPADYETVVESDYEGTLAENATTLTLDLSPFARQSDGVMLRFEDARPEDGWGAFVRGVRVRTTLAGKPTAYGFAPATSDEIRFLAEGGGQSNENGTRFADGAAFFTYRLPCDAGAEIHVEVDIAAQYRILARPADAERNVTAASEGLDLEVTLPANLRVTTYRRGPEGAPTALFRESVGKGTVTVCGVPASWFTSAEGDEVLPRLLLEPPATSPYLSVRRGPYLAVRALEGGSFATTGRFVDLLSPELQVLTEVSLGSDAYAFVKDWAPIVEAGRPTLIASTAHVEYASEEDGSLRYLFQGPIRTPGVARLYAGAATLELAEAVDQSGAALPVTLEREGDTWLLRYPCLPTGVAVRVAVR